MTALRTWWRNCALEADDDIRAIDRMEDSISPLSAEIRHIRELISSLELCHHKAEKWIFNIIQAIGYGTSKKGLGARSGGAHHPAEEVWENACSSLTSWCNGTTVQKNNLVVGEVPADQLISDLGERTPLKEWQVQRVIEKIRSVIDWSRDPAGQASEYRWILLSGGEYESAFRDKCPDYFNDDEKYWMATVKTFISDTENGAEAKLSLALAIDMLWPCHWRFLENLRIVLDAIGGNLQPDKPFAACGRNIHLVPNKSRLFVICNTLNHFQCKMVPGMEVDDEMLTLLGEPTDEKRWLTASLEKTIRLQLDPPDELQELAALDGPDWIYV